MEKPTTTLYECNEYKRLIPILKIVSEGFVLQGHLNSLGDLLGL